MICKDIAQLYYAANEFLLKVDAVENSEEFKGIFQSAHIHGVVYNGQNWIKERENLKKALENF